MKKNDEYKKDFLSETCLHVAIPLVKATRSWMSIEDAGDRVKARDLYFDALGKSKLYMTSAIKEKPDFVKVYIVNLSITKVTCLYVKKDVVCPGERYHHVTET